MHTTEADLVHSTGTGQAKGAPELRFESVAPTLQQVEQMATGLRILAEWLIRRHKRIAESGGEKPRKSP